MSWGKQIGKSRLLKEPSLLSNEILTIPKAGLVTVLDMVEHDFLKVKYNNQIGFIKETFIEKSNEYNKFIQMLKLKQAAEEEERHKAEEEKLKAEELKRQKELEKESNIDSLVIDLSEYRIVHKYPSSGSVELRDFCKQKAKILGLINAIMS